MYPVVHLPVIDMRESPDSESRVVSQALFGEELQIQAEKGDWICVQTPDQYSGWVKKGSFIDRSYQGDVETTRLAAHLYLAADTEYGPFVTLPFGSKLRVIEDIDFRWLKVEGIDGHSLFIQKGDVEVEPFDLTSFSKKFMGLPYTWGGRSSFGFDCSGFIQMLYSRMGIQLPRDARQQILDPRLKPVTIEQLKLGDLIFWGKSKQEIKHVGMSLGGIDFIHTSSRENKPYLRISKITDAEWNGCKEAYYLYGL